MRIAYVHQPWNRIVHRAPQGSVPIWTAEVSERVAREHEVFVYSRRFPDLSPSEAAGGMHYIRVDDPLDPWITRYVEPLTRVGRRRSPYSSALFYPQYYWRAAQDMARRGIDIVHVHSFPQAASIIRREHPAARIVVHLHVEWLNLLPPRLARRQVRDADLILGCSEYLADRMRQALPLDASRIRGVYNAVDVDLFTPPQEGESDDPFTVLFVGRISPEKGIHVLIDAFEKAVAVCPQLRLDIIGHDSPAPIHVFEHLADPQVVRSLQEFYDRSAMSKLRTWLRSRYPRRLERLRDTSYGAAIRHMASARLPHHVRFLGFVANHDLPAHYRRVQLVCQPSLTETFGIPLVEAMACGRPTVASRAGGIPEIVEDGITGILIPVFDADALKTAIVKLATDTEARRRMGAAGQQRARSLFSWDAVVSNLLELYRELLPTVARGQPASNPTRSAGAATAQRMAALS